MATPTEDRLMGSGYAMGSFLFAIGSLPLYFDHVDTAVAAGTFFVGSLFFTAAASLQTWTARTRDGWFARTPARVGWWSAFVQWTGTLAFNVSTLAATVTGLSVARQRRLVWAPDAVGSIAFLVAAGLGVWAVALAPSTRRDRRMAALNVLGSIAFGAAALGAFVLPTTGEVANIRIVNAGTALGAFCFLAGGVMQADPPSARV